VCRCRHEQWQCSDVMRLYEDGCRRYCSAYFMCLDRDADGLASLCHWQRQKVRSSSARMAALSPLL